MVSVLKGLGRIRSHRTAGSKLVFYDICDGEDKIQALCNLGNIQNEHREEHDHVRTKWTECTQILRRGDWVCESDSINEVEMFRSFKKSYHWLS